MRQLLIAVVVLLAAAAQPQTDPAVRIGLTQNASTVTVRSAGAFTINGHSTRAATFTTALAIDPAAQGAALTKADLQYRVTVQLDGDAVLVVPTGGRVRIEPAGSWLEIESRAYRGALEVFGNTRNTLTVVNELPLEEYLRGVVPNELNPTAFEQLEALKAQAVAARTYRDAGHRRDAWRRRDLCPQAHQRALQTPPENNR